MSNPTAEMDVILVHSVHGALDGLGAKSPRSFWLQGSAVRAGVEPWRRAFTNARTIAMIRSALADLWSRGGENKVVREHWQELVGYIQGDWQEAKGTAMFALACWAPHWVRKARENGAGNAVDGEEPPPPEVEEDVTSE